MDQREDRRRRLIERIELHRAYCRALAGADGDRVLADLSRRGFEQHSSYAPEPGRTEFNEGRRSLVLHIRRMLDENAFKPLIEEVSHD